MPRGPRPSSEVANRATRRPPAYDDALRAAALAVYVEQGLAAAHRQTGVPKSTLRDWARAAGVSEAVAAPVETAAATAAQLATNRSLAAQARERAIERLASTALKGVVLEERLIDVASAALEEAGSGTLQTATASRLEIMGGFPQLRAIVGSRTRAIHDLQLLTDEATERPAGDGLTIIFATPLPSAAALSAGHEIIDLDPDDVLEA